MLDAAPDHVELALEVVLIGEVVRRPHEQLGDPWRHRTRGRAARALVRPAPRASRARCWPSASTRSSRRRIACSRVTGRQETDGHPVAALLRQLEASLGSQEGVGELEQDAGAVPGVGVGALSAAVLEALERAERPGDNLVRSGRAQPRHECDAAGVVLVARVVQATRCLQCVTSLSAWPARLRRTTRKRTRNYRAMAMLPTAQTITVLSQKGGTGKTTTVRTLADTFRRVGLEVLVADLDPQGNLSDYYDVPADASPTVAEVLTGTAKAADAIHDGVLPANLGLAEAELVLAGKMGRELTLKRALRDLRRRYDLILIDCPPALGLLTVNALVAADHALISTEAEYFSLQGVEQALEVIELAKDSLHPDLDWLGVVLNIADMRLVHAREAQIQLKERFGERVFDTVVRRSVRYAESAERGVSILDYAPDLGADYLALAAEVLERLDGFEEARERLGTLTPA